MLPDCLVTVGQFDHGEGEFRVIDARGEGRGVLDPGATLTLEAAPGHYLAIGRGERLCNHVPADSVYGLLEITRTLGIQSIVGVPLELSSGERVGALSAISTVRDRFEAADLDLLAVMGRVLAYEWERVKRAHELRQIRQQLQDQQRTTDPLTGLADRTG